MPRIPLPRRGLRSLALLVVMFAVPYIALRQLHALYYMASPAAGAVAQARPQRAPLVGRAVDSGNLAAPDRGLVIQDRLVDLFGDPSVRKLSRGKNRQGGSGASRGVTHRYLLNGLVVPDPRGRHPIYDLVERAEAAWAARKAKASRTLREAVDEYRRRYGRAPPKGFDRWWNWAVKHNVQLPDEYDQINADLEPFWAIPSWELRKLRREAAAMPGMYTLSCPGTARKHGESSRCTYTMDQTGFTDWHVMISKERAEAQLAMVRQIEDELEEVEAVFYTQDVPWQFVGHDFKSALEDFGSMGEYFNVNEHEIDMAYLGWASACAPHKPLRKDYNASQLPDLDELWDAEKSFIWDHKAAMDPCQHPTMVHTQGFLAAHGKGPGPTKKLFPVMAMCKTPLHSDVLGVAEEAWTEDVGDDPPWEAKKDGRLLWRGQTTGIYFQEDLPWNISQRINLVSHTAKRDGTLAVVPVPPPTLPVGPPVLKPWADLNDNVDVGFVDEPLQCDKEICELVKETYEYKGRKNWTESNDYKYQLDLDGNGWSARFKRLMSTNSAVLKSTIFPEWYTDRVQPWVHYIPIKADLTDMYDVLEFFTNGHDDLARRIGLAGKDWSHRYWRREDMVAYQFRIYLELSRLMAPNRDQASYLLRGSEIEDVYDHY